MGLYNNLEPKIPEVKIERKRIPMPIVKAGCIVRALDDYGAENERDAVRIIEKYGVNKFDFDYPYGSFEAFKKHVLAGEFDIDIEAVMMTDEKRAEWDRALKAGEMKVIHEDHKNCRAWVESYPKKG